MGGSVRLNKKGLLLIGLAIIFLGVLCYSCATDYSSLTTDSGFDTGYSGGSSGGGSYSSSGGSGGGSISIEGFIYIFGMMIILALVTDRVGKSVKYHKYKNMVELTMICLIIGLPMITVNIIPILVVFIVLAFLFRYFEGMSKKVNTRLRNECYAKLTPDEKALLDECYKIFCDVQIAWMDFDYDKMRELVTDELFNQYQNQLKQLELKGEKNIMEDFELIEAEISPSKIEAGHEEIDVKMTVTFYDYIANNKNRIVRGNGNVKVRMIYALTFIRDTKAIHNCPNCNAELKEGQSVCEYCHAHIQSVTSKLKLAKKKALGLNDEKES